MSDEIRARRHNRRRFLEHLYRCSEEETTEYQDGYDVADELGITRQDAERIVRYLEDHGFVTKTGRTGLVLRITAQGIDHVESNHVASNHVEWNHVASNHVESAASAKEDA